MDRYIYKCALLVILMTSGAFAYAQGGYGVSGTVEDALGPLVGATVVEEGTSNGTSTGPDGGYSLTVASGDSPVTISCLGYVSVTYQASQVPSTVVLKEDTQYLNEAVVVGYGSAKKNQQIIRWLAANGQHRHGVDQ